MRLSSINKILSFSPPQQSQLLYSQPQQSPTPSNPSNPRLQYIQSTPRHRGPPPQVQALSVQATPSAHAGARHREKFYGCSPKRGSDRYKEGFILNPLN